MSAPELIVCSHRGPFEYRRVGGNLEPRRGGGGLINAVTPVLERFGGTWIAAPMSPADREVAAAEPQGRDEDGFHLRLLDLQRDAHEQHYDVVSNEHLWFLFHYLFDVASTPVFGGAFARAWEAYRTVNRAYAEAVASSRGDAVLVEDYHLMLVASALRERGYDGPMSYFHHTPWPEPDYLGLLPDPYRREMLTGLLDHDLVAFHCRRWADAFLRCCERHVPEAKRDGDAVHRPERTTTVAVTPVPLAEHRLAEEAADDRTRRWMQDIEEQRDGRTLVVRVDRIDLSKNPIRGYLAFEALLDRRPELAERVWFLALQYPSRSRVGRYRRYLGECLEVVQRVNDRYHHATPGEEGPIGFHFKDDFHQSLAAMRLHDAMLVNPVFDGLNLVAKEAALVSERDGVLILSRNAGVFEEIGEHALTVNPFDVQATADAIERAVEMDASERAERHRRLREASTRTTPEDWVRARVAPLGIAL